MAGGQLGLSGVADEGPSPREVIAELDALGYGDAAIAAQLNARDVPTPSGRGQWHASTVGHHRDPAGWREYQRRYRRGGT